MTFPPPLKLHLVGEEFLMNSHEMIVNVFILTVEVHLVYVKVPVLIIEGFILVVIQDTIKRYGGK